MADRLNCVVQAGHVPRTRGATGANGLLGTEQQFTLKTATYIQKWLTLRGWTCEMIGADDDIPDSTVFVAIHHDGSRNASARGPSVGYPADYKDGSKNCAQEWKRVYGAAYPGPSFRPDNYTAGLRGYYAFRKSTARIKLCCEHGFGSNAQDAAFMWSDAGQKAAVDAVEAVLGHWIGWSARRSPEEVHQALNPGAPPLHSQVSREKEQQTEQGSGGVSSPGGAESAGEGSAIPSAPPPAPDPTVQPEAQTPPPAPPASVTPPVVAEPPGRQSPEAEPPPVVTEELPVSEIKSKAGHTAWQASAAALVVAVLHGLGIETDLPDEAEIAAAVGVLATLMSAVKTWWQEDRPGGGRHTS